MSDEQTPNRPSHYAYQVRESESDKSYFNKVGAAWEHQDGQGYNIQLDSVPVNGRITLRTPQERVQDMRDEPAPQPQQQVQQMQGKGGVQQQLEPARQAEPAQQAAPQRDQGQER